MVGEFQIILSVVFFGVSFVICRYAMVDDKIGPYTFTACRFVVSTIFLYISRPYAQKLIMSELEKDDALDNSNFVSNDTTQLWLWGTICGASNLAASILLQIGLVTVSVGKAGFITGMYVVFIPVVEYFLPGYGVHLTWRSWLAAIVCLAGLYLISGCAEQDICFGGALKTGELLVMGSMLSWIVSIMVGDIGAKNLDVFSFTLVDFFVCSVFTVILAVIMEPESWKYPFTDITSNWIILLTIGLTEATAFPMSTMGQQFVAPARASLLMSLESLACALGGYLFLHEVLSRIETFGCFLMFVATLVSTSATDVVEEEEKQSSAASYSPVRDYESGSGLIQDITADDDNQKLSILTHQPDHKTFGSIQMISVQQSERIPINKQRTDSSSSVLSGTSSSSYQDRQGMQYMHSTSPRSRLRTSSNGGSVLSVSHHSRDGHVISHMHGRSVHFTARTTSAKDNNVTHDVGSQH